MPALESSRPRYPAIILQSAEVGIAKNGSISATYEMRTKSAKCGGLEINGPRERVSGLTPGIAVRRFAPRARGYWRFLRARKPGENVGRGRTGGEGGIRTHGTVARTTVFETAPIDHSGTSPSKQMRFDPVVRAKTDSRPSGACQPLLRRAVKSASRSCRLPRPSA